ncbi:MAG: preprotein translocase subunit SecG [Vicinamibacteria bacterium]|nr:preprotein translocase subunit SecG [Vicinamibacteria bacterium]
MTVLYYIVLILHLIACFFLIAVVLLQQGKGQDLASAFGGGGTQAAFGPRGSVTLLSRVTTGLAVVFMITSISLSILKQKESSLLDTIPAAASPTPAAAPTDMLGLPAVPVASPSATLPGGTASPEASSPASRPAVAPAATGQPDTSATPKQ